MTDLDYDTADELWTSKDGEIAIARWGCLTRYAASEIIDWTAETEEEAHEDWQRMVDGMAQEVGK